MQPFPTPRPLPDIPPLRIHKHAAEQSAPLFGSTPPRPPRPPRTRRPQTAPYTSSSSFSPTPAHADTPDPPLLLFTRSDASPLSTPLPSRPGTASSFLHRIPKPIAVHDSLHVHSALLSDTHHRGPAVSFARDPHAPGPARRPSTAHSCSTYSRQSTLPINVVADLRRRSANVKTEPWAPADDREWKRLEGRGQMHVWPESPTRAPLIRVRAASAAGAAATAFPGAYPHYDPPATALTLYADSTSASSIAEADEVQGDGKEKGKGRPRGRARSGSVFESDSDIEKAPKAMGRLLALLKFRSVPELKAGAAARGPRRSVGGGADEARADREREKGGVARRIWRRVVSSGRGCND